MAADADVDARPPMSPETAQTDAHLELATIVDERASRSASSDDELAIGASLGRYTLISQLGKGAMGSVYAAHDPLLDRKVALKVLHPERRARGTERLQREARALARLSHPNVVTINDVGRNGDQVYLAMELVEGQTLAAWLESGRKDWRRIVEVMREAGRGLAAVHAAGLVHRDFKPENVMLASDGRVLLADFGIALAESEALSVEVTQQAVSDIILSVSEELAPRLTQTGMLLGTPRYMAPEQFLKIDPDPRTDQWAFCAVLWEALFDQHPFGGENVAEIGMAVTTGARRGPPKEHRIPQVIVDAMIKGLDAVADRRHASMEELLRLIEPGRLIRRRARVVAGIGALVAFGALSALWPKSEATPCDGAARMADVWNEQRQGKVEAAFASVSLPLGEATQGRVIERLNEYRGQWLESYALACESQASADADQQAQLDPRFACLNERREDMDQLVSVLEEADDTVVINASTAVLQLRDVAECDDGDRGSEALPLPTDPALREQVEQVVAQLGEVRALSRAGRYPAAYEVAIEAHERSIALDYAPLRAASGLVLGVAQSEQGVTDRGQRLFEETVELAVGEGMDEIAAETAIALSTLAVNRTDASEARRWLRHAQASSGRLGHPPLLELELQAEEASLCHRLEGEQSDHERCRRLQQRVLERTVEHHGPRSLPAALAHARMGYVERKQGKYGEAIAQFEVAREIYIGLLGPTHPQVISILTEIQEAYRAQGDFARAHAVDEQVLPLLEAAYGPDHPNVLASLQHRANLLSAEGYAEEALVYFERILAAYDRIGGVEQARVVMTLGNRSIALGRVGRHEEAITDMRRALRLAEQVYEPNHTTMAVVLDNLGYALVEGGQPEQALPLHERALPIWEANVPGSPSVAISLTDYGRALLRSGRADEAVPRLERAVIIFGAHTVAPAELARARFVLAQALVDSGESLGRARRLADQAREAYDSSRGYAPEAAAVSAWLDEHEAPEPGSRP